MPELFPLFGGTRSLAEKAEAILSNSEERERIARALEKLKGQLALPGTSQRVAEKVLSFLPEERERSPEAPA